MRGARYLRRLWLIALALMAVHFTIILTVRSRLPAEYWVREFKMVKRFQASRMASPKIVFLGGSATLFGIDAAAVEKALGVPALNNGLMAGMRLEDLLAEARRNVKQGDVLVLSLEPPYYDALGTGWTAWQLRNALGWDPESFDRLPLFQRLLAAFGASNPQLSFDLCQAAWQKKHSPKTLRRREQAMAPESEIAARYLAHQGASKEFAFEIWNLDDHGDILHADHGTKPLPAPFAPNLPGRIQPAVQKLLAAFLSEMRARQVSVYFDYTPYLVEKPAGDAWKQSETLFESGLRDLGGEVLETRDHFFYPRRLLFDNELHLNTEGRALRTQSLIEALRPKLVNRK